ncbi:sec-independent protein translocase protein TatB [Alkalispirillum mobile]|uniref:Sec-independent protein translocase protein TatB n=1 Tax=Alkalispirillum mobile TaxID=85925 RepID=A0A498C585_9GAMM|nr:Sec-independent protein translocase protein TatB [Alkalispirillum mobile]RLK48140.1 sec-independent protein translocase protein TatB [Alkalispirillum mobile]
MFDLGFWEVLIIMLIGLLILGPERMARTVRTAGLYLGKARAAFNAAKSEVERELHVEEMRKATESVRKDVDKVRKDVEKDARRFEAEADGVSRAYRETGRKAASAESAGSSKESADKARGEGASEALSDQRGNSQPPAGGAPAGREAEPASDKAAGDPAVQEGGEERRQ